MFQRKVLWSTRINLRKISLLILIFISTFSFSFVYSSEKDLNIQHEYIQSLSNTLLPHPSSDMRLDVANKIHYVNKNKARVFSYKIPIYLETEYGAQIFPKISITKVLVNNIKVEYSFELLTKHHGIIVLGSDHKPLPKESNIEIQYTMNYQHYKDIPPITRFYNTFTRNEGSLPVKHLRLEIKAPTAHKLDYVDYYNLIAGKTVGNFVVDKSIDSVTVNSKGEVAANETTHVAASVSQAVAKTFYGQYTSTIFPTFPIDNDKYRISLSLVLIAISSWVIVKLLEAFVGNQVIRDIILSLRLKAQEFYIELEYLLGIRRYKKYKFYKLSG